MTVSMRRLQRQGESAVRAVLLALYLVFALFPIYWIVKISFTPDRTLFKEASRLWPSLDPINARTSKASSST